jgi:hypothetical protein
VRGLPRHFTNRRVGITILKHRRVVGAIRCYTVFANFSGDDGDYLTWVGAVVPFAGICDDGLEYCGCHCYLWAQIAAAHRQLLVGSTRRNEWTRVPSRGFLRAIRVKYADCLSPFPEPYGVQCVSAGYTSTRGSRTPCCAPRAATSSPSCFKSRAIIVECQSPSRGQYQHRSPSRSRLP